MPVKTPSDKSCKVGVLLTLADLYRQSMPGITDQYTRHWRRVLDDLLEGSATLHFAQTAHTGEEVGDAVRSCEQAGCDMLLVLPMAYAPSGAAIEALCETRLPILVISTSRDETLGHGITHDDLRANQAMHGVQDLANVLRRRSRNFVLLAGHHSQERFRRRLKQACVAAAGARTLCSARIGRLGPPFAGMLDFSYSAALLSGQLGLKILEVQPKLLGEKAVRIAAGETEGFLEWARKTFRVDLELSEEELRAAATWSLALEQIVEEHDLDGVAMNFQAVLAAGAETLPFLGADRLMSRGIGYAGEGDVLTAALTQTLHRICGQATFTETFCPDYRKDEILLSHMGECNPALADPGRPVLLKAKPFAIGKCIRPAVPVFQLKPGIVTLASLSESPVTKVGSPAGFQLVVFRGEIVPATEQPHLASPYSRLRVKGDLADFLEEYSKAGGTHHLALGYGDLVEELSAVAELSSLQFCCIKRD
jgi:L-arabinose isomerase